MNPMTSSLWPLLAFLLVVALIPLALWLMRRSGIAGTGQPGLMRTVSSLALSPSQKVVVVELGQGAGAKWLVLGVSAERITALHTLDTPLSLPTGELAQPQAVTVQQLIQRWRQPRQAGRRVVWEAKMASTERRRQALRLGLAGLGLLALCLPAAAQVTPPSGPTLPLMVGQGGGGTSYSVPIQTLLFFTALSFLPAVLLLMTGFTRIVIVLSLLRQAMGTQAAPPNQVVVGLSLFLTFFVMSPTLDKVYEQAWAPYSANQIDFTEALQRGQVPMRAFMLKQTRQSDMELFAKLAKVDPKVKGEDMPFKVIVPAFVTSELKTAFQIGFLIFIPSWSST
jgi:flagellar biosynthetic protein FliP